MDLLSINYFAGGDVWIIHIIKYPLNVSEKKCQTWRSHWKIKCQNRPSQNGQNPFPVRDLLWHKLNDEKLQCQGLESYKMMQRLLHEHPSDVYSHNKYAICTLAYLEFCHILFNHISESSKGCAKKKAKRRMSTRRKCGGEKLVLSNMTVNHGIIISCFYNWFCKLKQK